MFFRNPTKDKFRYILIYKKIYPLHNIPTSHSYFNHKRPKISYIITYKFPFIYYMFHTFSNLLTLMLKSYKNICGFKNFLIKFI